MLSVRPRPPLFAKNNRLHRDVIVEIVKEHLEKLIKCSKSGIATHTESMNENLRVAKCYMDEINNAQKVIAGCEEVLALLAKSK